MEKRYCNRCDNEVMESDLKEQYSFQCLECDEDLYKFETYTQNNTKVKEKPIALTY